MSSSAFVGATLLRHSSTGASFLMPFAKRLRSPETKRVTCEKERRRRRRFDGSWTKSSSSSLELTSVLFPPMSTKRKFDKCSRESPERTDGSERTHARTNSERTHARTNSERTHAHLCTDRRRWSCRVSRHRPFPDAGRNRSPRDASFDDRAPSPASCLFAVFEFFVPRSETRVRRHITLCMRLLSKTVHRSHAENRRPAIPLS